MTCRVQDVAELLGMMVEDHKRLQPNVKTYAYDFFLSQLIQRTFNYLLTIIARRLFQFQLVFAFMNA